MTATTYAQHLCLSVDVESYSRRNDRAQEDTQNDLVALLDRAAKEARIRRDTWHIQGSGDGQLSLIPLSGSEPQIVDDLIRRMDTELYRYNATRNASAGIRLRVAIDQGVGYPSSNGFAGDAVVRVSRLVDSRPVRQALSGFPAANLALILSDEIYRQLILPDHTTYRAEQFRQVTAQVKEFAATAWVTVPGHDVHVLHSLEAADSGSDGDHPATDPPASDRSEGVRQHGRASTVNQAGRDVHIEVTREPQPAAPSNVNHFHHAVDGRYANFGVVGDPDGRRHG